MGFPELRQATTIIETAQVASLFSVPVLLTPGVFGKVLVPEAIRAYKEPGNAWTTTGSGRLQVKWQGTSPQAFATFDQGTTDAYFVAAETTWLAVNGTGSTNAANNGPCGLVLPLTNALVNKGLVLSLASADITVGSGRIFCDVWYREWLPVGLIPF